VLSAKGEGGHSARPPKGNAIANIGQAIADLQAAPMAARLPGPVVEMFEHLGKELPLTIRLALANRWLFEALILKRLSNGVATNASIRSTITPTIIQGGIKSNVIPQEVTATLNVRLLPGNTLDDVLHHIAKTTGAIIAADRLDHPDCAPAPCLVVGATNKKDWEPAPISDTQSRWFGALSRSIGQTFPDTAIAPGMVIGITDSRHYRSLSENIFRFVPVRLERSDLSRIHGTNERISIADYGKLILFYERMLQNVAGQ
jgi:carboxypeptidase PM20D1